jgi:hypothetical protein
MFTISVPVTGYKPRLLVKSVHLTEHLHLNNTVLKFGNPY